MAKYVNINGNNIPIRSSDPSNPLIGEMWYNSTSNSLKGQINVASASWATGTNYPTAVRDATGFGTSTAAIIMGGNAPPTTSAANTYDGSSWTSTTAVPAAVSGADSAGPQTAMVLLGQQVQQYLVGLKEHLVEEHPLTLLFKGILQLELELKIMMAQLGQLEMLLITAIIMVEQVDQLQMV